MNPLTIFALGVVAVVVVALLALAWQRGSQSMAKNREAKEQLRRARAERCRFRGWQYADVDEAAIKFRIFGRSENGFDWQAYFDSDHQSSSPSPKLVFEAKTFAARDLREQWELADRKVWELTHKGAAKAIIGGVSSLVAMMNPGYAAKAEFYKSAKECSAGSSAFRERFVVAALDTRWGRVVDAEIEKRILSCPTFKPSLSNRDNCISACVDQNALETKLYVDGPDADTMENVIDLGLALVERVRKIRQNAL